MQIDFYEEFPTRQNLGKLKLIKFKTRLFVAAKSLGEFQKIEKQVKKIKKNTDVAYWPLIENSYWISPFSNTQDLIKTFKDLGRIKNSILIDLEFPRNNRMILKNLLSFFGNKKIIRRFLIKNRKRVTVAEYSNPTKLALMKILGLNYWVDCDKSPMFYTSMKSHKEIKNTKKYLSGIKNKKQYAVSLGTIAIGIQGNEPILSPKNLEKNLEFVEKVGFNKVIIFRLGGLNKKYLKILNKFAKEDAN